jgi:peptidoglycan/LPS O-acetylase OafA/YrhL
MKAPILLGAMSYSVYLTHGKLAGLSAQLTRQLVSVDSVLFPVLAIGATLVLCYPFFRMCEKPFVGGFQTNRKPTGAFPKLEAPIGQASAAPEPCLEPAR